MPSEYKSSRNYRFAAICGAALSLAGGATAAQQTIAPASISQPWASIEAYPANCTAGKLVLGPKDGVPRIAYLCGNSEIYFAELDLQTGAWDATPVSSGSAGGHSLAVDSQSNVYVAYNDSAAFGQWGALRLAEHIGGTWSMQVIDTTLNYGYSTSIGVDAGGGLHVLGKQEQDGALWYWTRQAGVWSGELVDSDSNPGRYQRIVIDSQGRPHSIYSTWSPKSDIRYAVRTGPGQWQFHTIDYASDTYRAIGFDLDSQDNPHVAYHDGNDLLYYTAFDGVSWSPRKLVFTSGGKYASLCVDRLDRVHIAVHTNAAPSSVYWMMKRPNGAWTAPQFVSPGTVTGGGQSLQTDVFGRPGILVNHAPDGGTLFAR